VRDLIMVLNDFKERGIKFRSLTENIETETPTARAMWQMIAIPPELERIQITERTQSGIAAAKARGVQFGRKKNVGTIRPSRSAKASNREKRLRTLWKASILAEAHFIGRLPVESVPAGSPLISTLRFEMLGARIFLCWRVVPFLTLFEQSSRG
jgi:DNA invertase Pin-like site-specific DNA recombinase